MTTLAKKGRALLKTTDLDAAMAVLLAVSIFLPVYISVLAVSAAAVLTMINFEKRQKAFASPGARFLLGFMVVPFFVAAVYNNTLGMLATLLLCALLTCGMYLRSIMTRPLFNKILDICCALSVACAALALIQKLLMFSAQPEFRPYATFYNANYYGAVIELVVLAAMYRAFTNTHFRALYLAVIAINLGGLYLCASMSSAAALCCGVVIMLMMKHKSKAALIFLIAVAVFAALSFVFPLLFPRVESIDYTLSQRLSIWEGSLHAIKQHPLLGWGAMGYQMIYPMYGSYPTAHAHNLLLDILLNYGLVGFLAIAAYAAIQARLLFKRFQNRIFNNMNILVLAAAAAVLTHGLTDVTILWVQTGLLFLFLFSGIGVGSEYLERKMLTGSILPDYAVERAAGTTF